MGFVKERAFLPPLATTHRRVWPRLLCLPVGVCLLVGMHRPLPVLPAAPVVASQTVVGTESPEPRHVLTSGGAIARVLAAVVVRGRSLTADDRAEAKRRLHDGAPGTYIDEVLIERDSSLARWPNRPDRPLTVWIQPRSSVADFKPGYADRVHDAFLQWDAVDLPVRFTFVDDSAHAEVHVTWIDRFDQPISGRTVWGRDDDWSITDANIILAMHHHQGDLLDEDSMHAMAMHEIGHLLGLDHTSDDSSIMAPKVRVRELSDADRATVRLLYSLPAGPFR